MQRALCLRVCVCVCVCVCMDFVCLHNARPLGVDVRMLYWLSKRQLVNQSARTFAILFGSACTCRRKCIDYYTQAESIVEGMNLGTFVHAYRRGYVERASMVQDRPASSN